MPRKALYSLHWSSQLQTYELRQNNNLVFNTLTTESQSWQNWLETASSFAFYSQSGAYCTVRKEIIQEHGAYWYGYRSLHKQTIKRYIGRTVDITLARLEEIAQSFSDASPMPIASAKTSSETRPPSTSEPLPTLLLESKLQLPRLPSVLVERLELYERLDQWPAYKVTLVCASAGSGKTTLIRSWLDQRQLTEQTAWISLDKGDNDPRLFWSYIFTACRSWLPPAKQHLFTTLTADTQSFSSSSSIEGLLTAFLNVVVHLKSSRLLVLENYHVILNPDIQQALGFLLDHLPEKLHILLLTRTEPPLPLSRLQANSEINVFQSADLRFSSEEMLTFLQQSFAPQYPFTKEQQERLIKQLAGWPAGLRLFSSVLQGKRTSAQIEQALASFNGQHYFIREYFVSEVLQAQSAKIQDFLLYTSVLPIVTPPLCTIITGQENSAAILENSIRNNLFLELDEKKEGHYHYYSLFAEAMQYELQQRLDKQTITQIFAQAGNWFEQNGFLPEAIDTAFKAEQQESAAVLLEHYVKTIHFPEMEPLTYQKVRIWMEQLSQSLLMQSPTLCLNYALIIIFSRRDAPSFDQSVSSSQVAELMDQAEKGWRAHNDLMGLGQVFSLRAFLSYQHKNMREQALGLAKQALDWLPEVASQWRGMSLGILGMDALFAGQFGEAHYHFQAILSLWPPAQKTDMQDGLTILLGLICYQQGNLYQAASYYRRLINEDTLCNKPAIAAIALSGLALVCYDWNDLVMAQQQLQQAAQLAEQNADIPAEFLQGLITFVHALVEHAQGKTEQAIQSLTDLVGAWRVNPEGFYLLFYHEARNWLIRLALLLDDQATAHHWLYTMRHPSQPKTHLLPAPVANRDESGPVQPAVETEQVHLSTDESFNMASSPVFQEQETLLLARLYLTRDNAQAALNLLEDCLPTAQTAGRGRNVLQIQMLMAQSYDLLKQKSKGHQMLLAGLQQAYSEGNQRAVLDEGEKIFLLLRDLYPQLQDQSLKGYTQTLLESFVQRQTTNSTIITHVMNEFYEPLSPQEERVLRLLARGYSNAEIARELVVSINTIRTQTQSIYRKLQVNNRHAASKIAHNLQLL